MIFNIEHKDAFSKAKAGILRTAHGTIQTPVFMPVGTQGSVKSLSVPQLENLDAQIILGNTYHLYLRPGQEVLQKAGGLHHFKGWTRPMLTDSGGYQVFSLAQQRKISEDGVLFNSHIDGSKHLFTPENVISTQRSIGADIMMAFDECTPYPATYTYTQHSMQRTHRWLDRCLKAYTLLPPLYDYEQYIFPIIQGGMFKSLRKESCTFICEKQPEGIAIGGLSVGEPETQMYELCAHCTEHTPDNIPRYLMGVGTPANILNAIALGIDMFDCIMPTRNGRNGMLFTTEGIIHITNKKWQYDYNPIDTKVPNAPLSHLYSKAYLRHLFIAKELLALTIASAQNIAFYLYLISEARKQILQNTFLTWKENIIPIITQKI